MSKVSELSDAPENAAHTAEIDALTGLASRGKGEAYLSYQLAVQHPTVVMLIDLNNLKRFNHRWGHACGDQILQSVARELTECAYRFSLVCRWEEDKFLVASHPISDIAEREAVSLRDQMAKRYTVAAGNPPVELEITASARVALAEWGDRVSDLIARAESDLLHHSL